MHLDNPISGSYSRVFQGSRAKNSWDDFTKAAGAFLKAQKSKVDKKNRVGSPAKGKGAYNGNITKESGFGRLDGKEINPTHRGLDKIKTHISNNEFDAPENTAMIERIEKAIKSGKKLSGADASYYMHEIKESTLMAKGMSYKQAHKAALETYKVSAFSVYHPEVILKDPSSWSKPWFDFWKLKK